jgi:hypothetical protein
LFDFLKHFLTTFCLQDLKWGVDSPADTSVAAVEQLVAELNNKTESW